jgi:hypothetical protein
MKNKKENLEDILKFLKNIGCRIVNESEIRGFLKDNVSIIGYLYEAPGVIRNKFGKVNLNLELVFDPEDESDEGELFLNIETNLDFKEAHKKLEEITREWLIPVVGNDVYRFNIDVDFI